MVMTTQAVADLAIAELNTHLAPAYTQQAPAWTRVAATTYRQLRDHDATTNPSPQTRPDPPLCHANRDELRAWLTSPAPDAPGKTVAQRLQLDDTFAADGANVDTRLGRLLVEAQHNAVFGIAEHGVETWHLADTGPVPGYLISVQPPTGPDLVDGAHSAQDLFGDSRHAIEAAVHALSAIPHRTNTVLAEQTRQPRIATPTPPTTRASTTATAAAAVTAGVDRPPPAAGRAFAAPAHAVSSATPAPAPATDAASATARVHTADTSGVHSDHTTART
jgi:hypothetical protein